MDKDVLDHFDDFEDQFDLNTEIIAIKFFYFESKARLYAARLNEAGIPSFISNANTSTVIPLGGGGIGLHIKKQDLKEAFSIINILDKYNTDGKNDFTYHDADFEDIAYEKAIHENQGNYKIEPTVLLSVLLIIFLLVAALLRTSGWI